MAIAISMFVIIKKTLSYTVIKKRKSCLYFKYLNKTLFAHVMCIKLAEKFLVLSSG